MQKARTAQLACATCDAPIDLLEGVPVLSQVVTPDRWLLWLGVLFVLSVYHFPTGLVGRLRLAAGR